MRLKNKITPEEQALFRHAVRGVKPLSATKAKVIPEPRFPARRRPTPASQEVPLLDPFSDHEYLEPVKSEERLDFAHPSLSTKITRSLRRGQVQIEAILDLHGQTVAEARLSLHQFLLACQQEEKSQVLIIHGKGRHNSKPILKNKLNHWLRQTEQVLAFCSATAEDGGNGALYLRLKKKAAS
jgi:DNA-nicking Smr family endonuclease